MTTASANTPVRTIELFASAFDQNARDRLDILEAREIATSGLATGGGDLSADFVITVPKASGAEAAAGVNDTKALTPLALAMPIATLQTSVTAEAASRAAGDTTNATSIASHTANVSNPHTVTKAQLGLGSVDNTADASKPVSTAQATAIAVVQTSADTNAASLASHTANVSNPHSTTKTQVGLALVDNTADASKPVSAAQATAIAAVQAAADAAQTTANAAVASAVPVPALVAAAGARPGDSMALYGASVTGAPSSITAINSAWVNTSAAGRVLRVSGASASNPQTVAPIAAFAIDAGYIYELRFKVQRQTDPGDPLSDSVTLAIGWLDNTKATAGIASGSRVTTIQNIPLVIADGVFEKIVTVSTSALNGSDYVAPAGAIYFRPYVQMFGADHVTDIISIEVSRVRASQVVFGNSMVIKKLSADPVAGPGAGLVRLYVVEGTGSAATLRMQAGTDATPIDVMTDVGSGF